MTDEKQSGKAVLLVVIILALMGVVWALANRITEEAQEGPGFVGRR